MSLSSHLEELRKKHEALDEAIKTAGRQPARDELEIAQMKKRKLQLKEEIIRLGGA